MLAGELVAWLEEVEECQECLFGFDELVKDVLRLGRISLSRHLVLSDGLGETMDTWSRTKTRASGGAVADRGVEDERSPSPSPST